MYNGNNVLQLTDNNAEDRGVTVSDGKVVWEGSDGNDFEIFIYDGNSITQLTDNNTDDINPDISGDNIVWQGQDGNDTEIFLASLNESGIEDSETAGAAVYRFFNTNSGVHFYTADEREKDAVQELVNFNFEGASYLSVDPLSGEPEPVPVYRFLNQNTGVHLYTTSETERDVVQELDNFSFEGEAFFAYESEVEGSIPIYRFFNNTSGAHFYTPSANERDNVENNLPEFQSEGIAYYALPLAE